MSEPEKDAFKRTLVINSPRFIKLHEEMKNRYGVDRNGITNPIINQILEQGLAIEEEYSTKLEYFIETGPLEKFLISSILNHGKSKASNEIKAAMISTLARVIGYEGDVIATPEKPISQQVCSVGNSSTLYDGPSAALDNEKPSLSEKKILQKGMSVGASWLNPD